METQTSGADEAGHTGVRDAGDESKTGPNVLIFACFNEAGVTGHADPCEVRPGDRTPEAS